MKPFLVVLFAVALVAVPALAEIVLFEEGFGTPTEGTYCDPAFPAGWALADEDGLTPAGDVSFVTSAWVTYDDPFDGANCAAVSTSWYDPPGTADDWMVTPEIHLPEGAVLSWRAFTEDPKYSDGYQVLYSTSGSTVPDDFEGNVLFDLFEEQTVWTAHAVDLDGAGLGGRAVRFAFRNNSVDRLLLYVDDIRVTLDNAVFREEFGGVGLNGKCDPVFPADWVRIDVDGQTPDSLVSFVTDAWVARNEDWAAFGLAECVAISTSFYEQPPPPDPADDWMITPLIEVPSAASLEWRAIADDFSFPDGYEVRYSTGGTATGDFTSHAALFSVAAENPEWTHHSVDLDALGLGGQSLRFAFRNVSDDQFLLLVDSVEVTEPIVFRDGFDSGYAGAWSVAVGVAP